MTYSESAAGVTVSRQRALQELNKHGITDFGEFFNDCGDKEAYAATEVLQWLGY